jgi:hypothetical protein
MAHDDPNQSRTKPTTSNRTQSGRASPGCRVVHVAVPEEVFNHAKAQAYLSGIRWPEFVARLLSEARPFDDCQTVSST